MNPQKDSISFHTWFIATNRLHHGSRIYKLDYRIKYVSKYMPHQGKQEMERRKGEIINYDSSNR